MNTRLPIAAALVLLCVACGNDEVCGPAETAGAGLTATADGKTVTFGNLNSSPNNDCPTANHATSVTIDGTQIAPTAENLHFTLCLPRPDDIGSAPIDFSDSTMVQLIDVTGRVDGCLLRLPVGQTPTGTITFTGFCDDGTHPDGYSVEMNGSVGATLDCGADAGTPQSVTITLGGSAAVIAL